MSVNVALNAALAGLEDQRTALLNATHGLLVPQQGLDNLTLASTQMERDIAQMELDQALNTTNGAQLRVNRAELAVTATTQAVEAALGAPGTERARGNLGLQITARANPRGEMIVRNVTDLTALDREALSTIIARCYAAAGGLPNAAPTNAFTNKFLNDIFGGGWSSILEPNEKPAEPAAREQKQCAVRMGVLFRDCDPTKHNPIRGGHRRAEAAVHCGRRGRDRLWLIYQCGKRRAEQKIYRGARGDDSRVGCHHDLKTSAPLKDHPGCSPAL
jgi:hypothetical protein